MESVTFVLFGATGDLATTRLVPSFARLVTKGQVGPESIIVAVGRRPLDDSSYRALIHTKDLGPVKILYHQADLEHPHGLADLHTFLLRHHAPKHRIFYLSISYTLFPLVIQQLKEHRLHTSQDGFSRIIFEKPFGGDLASARHMDNEIHHVFNEEDVYRIDHYLGKETVENFLAFRFSNPLFERIWNHEFIDRIFIRSDETDGVGHRVGYYDTSGALRDMVQNHLLQLLSFVLMDAPMSLEPNAISEQKKNAIASLHLKSHHDIVIGQYDDYQEEIKKIHPGSTTETFIGLRFHSSLPRWNGVPIIIRTGKKLPTKEAEVVIDFKKEPCLHYCNLLTPPNRLIIRIQPEQDILLSMNVRNARTDAVEESSMVFSHAVHFKSNSVEAYEKLIAQCILGNKTLFPRFDELQEAWKIVEKIEAQKSKTPLLQYSKERPEPVLHAFNVRR